MQQFIQFAVLGFGIAGIYALLSQGLVLIYRGTGVLNFANGAFAAASAYVFYELHYPDGWAFAPACAVAVALAAVIGALTHLLIMRPLRRASSLGRLVATLGLLSLIQGIVELRLNGRVIIVPTSLPQSTFSVAGITFTSDRLFLLAIAAAITIALTLVTRYTVPGLAISAVAENQMATAALGWSPDVMATLTWAVGGAMAGLAGILIVPFIGLQPEQLTLLVITATAAALVARFQSFPVAFFASLAIGIAISELTNYTTSPGYASAVPFGVIILVLVVRGTALPLRGFALDRLPTVGRGIPRPSVTAVLVLVLSVAMFELFSTNVTIAIGVQATAGLILLSIVLLTGYAGQVSLGQFAMAGLGALCAAKLVADWHWPFGVAVVAGMVGAAITGLVFGLPALRTRGVSLAVVTLGLGYVVETNIFSNTTLTGGTYGTFVGAPHLFGLNLDPVLYPARYATFCLVAFALVALAIASLRRGRVGRRLLAIRDSERAAASVGVSVFGSKMYAFGLASAIAGLGGTLLAFSNSTVLYTNYSSENSINAVGNATIGGIAFVTGPVFGSFFASGSLGNLLLDKIGDLGNWLTVITGIAVLATLLLSPNGQAAQMFDHLRALTKNRTFPRPVRLASRRRGDIVTRHVESVTPTPMDAVASDRVDALTVSNLSVVLGGNHILNSVSLEIRPGEILGLIGPNGAGKSTVIDSICGFVRPESGEINLGSASLIGLPAYKRTRLGVARSFQGLELFEDVTILENIQIACDRRDKRSYLTGLVSGRSDDLPPRVWSAIDECRLTPDLGRRPGEVPYGRRRLIAIVRAIATGASVVLLDEPAAGLSDLETRELSTLISRMARRWGLGVLLVEHDMTLVMSVCDRIAVLSSGTKIAEGKPAEVRADHRVIMAYLGDST